MMNNDVPGTSSSTNSHPASASMTDTENDANGESLEVQAIAPVGTDPSALPAEGRMDVDPPATRVPQQLAVAPVPSQQQPQPQLNELKDLWRRYYLAAAEDQRRLDRGLGGDPCAPDLLLQLAPTMTPAQVLDLLQRHALLERHNEALKRRYEEALRKLFRPEAELGRRDNLPSPPPYTEHEASTSGQARLGGGGEGGPVNLGST